MEDFTRLLVSLRSAHHRGALTDDDYEQAKAALFRLASRSQDGQVAQEAHYYQIAYDYGQSTEPESLS
jgi:hypothetical protein